MARVLRIKTDIMSPTIASPSLEAFPTFDDFYPFEDPIATMAEHEVTPPRNKLVDKFLTTPDRKPSPQPTHFSVPLHRNGGNGQRVIRSATIGYVAPEFKGKKVQQERGKIPYAVVLESD